MLVASLPAGTVTYSQTYGRVHLLYTSVSMGRQALCTPGSSGSVQLPTPLTLSGPLEVMNTFPAPEHLPYLPSVLSFFLRHSLKVI